MLASNEFSQKMVMAAADAPAVRNEHTKKLLRLALKRMNEPAAALDLSTASPEPEIMRLNAGAPCDVSAVTVDDKVKFQLTLDRNDDGELAFGGFAWQDLRRPVGSAPDVLRDQPPDRRRRRAEPVCVRRALDAPQG